MIGLLTLRGRLTRTNFWRLCVLVALVEAVVEHFAGWPRFVPLAEVLTSPPAHLALHGAASIVLAGLFATRLHDVDRTGAWAAIAFAAALLAKVAGPIGVAAIAVAAAGWLALSLWAGTIGPNRFGEDPRGWESHDHFEAQQRALAEDAAISARGGHRFH